jgi:hypothetical protein
MAIGISGVGIIIIILAAVVLASAFVGLVIWLLGRPGRTA